MLIESMLVLLAAGAGGITYARTKRSTLYDTLEKRIGAISSTNEIALDVALRGPPPPFDNRLAQLSKVLPDSALDTIRRQALDLVGPERSYIPAHKKGGTVAYESLFDAAPAIIALYHSPALHRLVSQIVGASVRTTPIHDQSSLSVLFYEKPGDHIGWHYDHNFYRGRHFTVLLPIINQGSGEAGLSHAKLQAMIDGREVDIPTPPNALIVFEGAHVSHKVTPIMAGERRLVISMTYCTDPRANLMQGAVRRIKDVAFFGPRALWT